MAVHIALLMFLCGTGLVLARPRSGLMAVVTNDLLGGLMDRRLLPLVVCAAHNHRLAATEDARRRIIQHRIGTALAAGAYMLIVPPDGDQCAKIEPPGRRPTPRRGV